MTTDHNTGQAAWTAEGVAFLRRVMGGEVYTGMSGEALARWAVGLTDRLADRPYDKGDLARCMNVYWSAPDELKPKMRAQLGIWSERLRIDPEFTTRRYYRRGDDLHAYWSRTPASTTPGDNHRCPKCDDGDGEHTRLYGCRLDDLHDWPGAATPPASTTTEEADRG